MINLNIWIIWLGLAIFGLTCEMPSALAQPADPTWDSLLAFVGTYPSASPQSGKLALMQTGLVRMALAKLLTPSELAILASYTVSPPVAPIGMDLLVQFCMPHDCGNKSAVIVIDPTAQIIWIAFYTTDERKFRTDWIGTADPANLPAPILAAISKIHSPF